MMAKTILVAVFVVLVTVAKVHGDCICPRSLDPVCGTDGIKYANPVCLENCGGGVSTVFCLNFELIITHDIGLIQYS